MKHNQEPDAILMLKADFESEVRRVKKWIIGMAITVSAVATVVLTIAYQKMMSQATPPASPRAALIVIIVSQQLTPHLLN